MHHTLQRQIKKYIGRDVVIPKEWALFFDSVSATYTDFDEDRAFLSHAMDVNSQEFLDSNRKLEETRLKVENQAQNLVVEVAKRTKELDDRILELEDVRSAMTNLLDDFWKEQKELAAAKAKVEAIISSMGDGLIATDKGNMIVMANKSIERITGWTESEIVGKSIFDIYHILDELGNKISEDEEMFSRVAKGGGSVDLSVFVKRKDGALIPVAITGAQIVVDSEIIGTVGVFRDITKEKELDRAKTEFISIASHQLRTPVSGLSWLTEALQFTSENLNPKQKKYVADLSMLSKRLIGLVEDLLNISRIQLRSELTTEKNSIDFVAFVEEFLKEIEPYANSKKHKIVFNKKNKKPINLEINKKSLYNVMQNLVSNAIEYSPPDTIVTVDLEIDGDSFKTSISNKGPVIPMDEQAHLFGRFYRGESAKKMKAGGTGLGLYIIKMIIEEMGGSVGFISEQGKDTAFWFRLKLQT